jgi:peroxidase
VYLVCRVSVALVGGPHWGVPLGRLDGCVSQVGAPPIHLPSGQATVTKAQGGAPQSLRGNFKHVGLDLKDLVALSGRQDRATTPPHTFHHPATHTQR